MSEQKQCRACDHPRESSGRYGCVRTSWSAMKAQTKLGCVTCGILSEGIEKVLHDEKVPADHDGDWQLRLDFNMHGAESSLDIVVFDTGTVITFFCSQVTPWLSKTLPDIPVAFDVPRQTSSPESFAWVRQQIKECQRSHPACIGLNIRSTFPQRVLDVQANPIRLHQSQGEHEPYICLSHVWGDRPFLQTTKDNFAAHKKAIDFDSLPPTFQQAVRYTQELGVRYLWIDSLCIVQDDPHDWETQASSMALIFQDSFLVLSAARSPNAYGGLYAEFPSRCKTHTVEVQVTSDTGVSSLATEKVHVRRSLAHLNSGRFMNQWLDSWHTNTLLPTLTRGWIFQERFLAPRVLHFGPEELSWECLRHSTCQCTTPQPPHKTNRGTITNDAGASNDSSIPDKIIAKIDLPTWHKQAITRNTRPKSYYNFWAWMALARKPTAAVSTKPWHNDELTACWHHLIEDYTKLSLTFEKDIFPAISGLAHLMWTALDSREKPASRPGSNPIKNGVNKSHMMSPDRYFAGLWSHSLHRDILWRVGDQITPRRPDKWRAPSWSWASVKGAVEFLDQTEEIKPKCEVLGEVDCALAGIDDFGELVDVSGKNILVLEGTVLSSGVSFKGSVPSGSGTGLVKNDEWKENLRAWEVMELDIFRGHLKNVWADDCDTERLGGGEQNREVYCLLVGIKKSNALCFLILRQVEDDGPNAEADDGAGEMYCRIGVAEVFGGPAGPGPWKERLFAGGNVQTVKIS